MNRCRLFAVMLLAGLLVTPTSAAEPVSKLPQTLHLHAAQVIYDADHFTIVARGQVELELPRGVKATARYFSMDLKANRYLLAGHVHLEGPNLKLDAAGVANFLEFQRVYVLASDHVPDHITYLDETFSQAIAGREMPGDAFALPENLSKHPQLVGKDVVIHPKSDVHFAMSELNTSVVTVPVPDYVINLSSNPNFSQNSLAGANFDASYPFAGSGNANTAFHLRVGGGNGVFGAIEQRLVSPRAYLVGSISPLNHSLKQYNLLGSYTLSPTLQIQTFAQEQAFQHGFSQPLNASLYLDIRTTQALKHSYLQYTIDQYYQSLLANPNNACNCYGDGSHVFIPNHPIEMQLAWIGQDHKIAKLPLKYRLRSGYDYDHDQFGILPASASSTPGSITYTPLTPQGAALIGVGVPTMTYSFIGGTISTPSYRLSRDSHGNDVYLNASFDTQRKSYSLPHQINTATTKISLSKSYGTKMSTYLAYTIAHTGDQYGSQQRLVYPMPTDGLNPEFAGFATLRTLSQGFVYTPNPNFNSSLIFAETNDFPKTVPTVFGPAPFSITGEVRAQLRPHLRVDLSRTYYYNFGAQHFSPTFALQVSG